MEKKRTGYEADVGRFRAKSAMVDPDLDRAPMVQELVARLRFASAQVPMEGKAVLDYGCGTGLALQWLKLHTPPARAVGLDISDGAISFARRYFPGFEFRVMDIETPCPDLREQFDVVLCFEVLEHLHIPGDALGHVAGHYLKSDGILVATTPNRMVFSGGQEPSPINRTHVHEMNLAEFTELLHRHFREVVLWGMRFRDPNQTVAHARMIRHACAGSRLLGDLWWNPTVNRFYRWIWRGGLWHFLRARQHFRWGATDFEFIDDASQIAETAIWFLAFASKQVPSSSRTVTN
jgi:SAM-dependent methyltransferase